MKEITITNGELEEATRALGRIGAKEISAVLSFRLAKLSDELSRAQRPLLDARIKLFQTFGKPNPQRGGYDIPDDLDEQAAERFVRALRDLNEERIEIRFQPIQMETLDMLESEDIKIRPADLSALIEFFEGNGTMTPEEDEPGE